MTKQDYAAERLDPRWQRKRLEIMQRDGFKCRSCECTENTLHIHHSYYVKGRKCWDYPDFSLKTLCDECHDTEHQMTIDPIDGESSIKEWEMEINWLLLGDSCNEQFFWGLAAEMSQAFTEGFTYSDVIASVRAMRGNK